MKVLVFSAPPGRQAELLGADSSRLRMWGNRSVRLGTSGVVFFYVKDDWRCCIGTRLSGSVCGTHSEYLVFLYIFVCTEWQIFHLRFQTQGKMHVCVITDRVIDIPDILNDKPQVILYSKMDLEHSANKTFFLHPTDSVSDMQLPVP